MVRNIFEKSTNFFNIGRSCSETPFFLPMPTQALLAVELTTSAASLSLDLHSFGVSAIRLDYPKLGGMPFASTCKTPADWTHVLFDGLSSPMRVFNGHRP